MRATLALLASAGISTAALAAPDLRVQSLTAPPQLEAGTAFAADYQLRNAGADAAFNVLTAVWLSADVTLDAGDASLCSHTLVSVNAGRNASGTASGCRIPTGTAPGTWYLLAEADANDQIAEANEADNLGSAVLVVGTPGGPPTDAPDLRVTRVDAPAEVAPGELLRLGATVRNGGTQDADGALVQLRLSADELWDAGDALLCAGRVGAVAVGATAAVEVEGCAVPEGADAGAAYVIATVDAASEVVELDELNNSKAVAVTVGAPVDGPDLTIVGVDALPETGPGGTFDLFYEVENAGSDGSGASRTRAWWSADAARDGADLPLCDGAVSSVPARTTATEVLRGCVVPDEAPSGPGFLLLAADADASLAEESEANNLFSAAWTLGEPVVDTGEPAAPDAPFGQDYADLGCACGHGGGALPALWLTPALGLARRRRAR
jgi:subtilase family serine protease